MYPGRSRYEPSDVTSPAYLRTTASYAEFLQKQGHNMPPGGRPERTPGFPPGDGYPSRALSWRAGPPPPHTHPPRGPPHPPHPQFPDQGWRREPSWRGPAPYQPSPSESWIPRGQGPVKTPPGPDPQRYIAPAEEQRRHIVPAAVPPNYHHEMWRGPPNSNWRKEPLESPGRRSFEPQYPGSGGHRNGRPKEEMQSPRERPPAHRPPSPRELPPTPKKKATSPFYHGSPPPERRLSRQLSPCPASRESYPPSAQKSPEVPPRIESPVRNRILPAEKVFPRGPAADFNGKWGEPRGRSRGEFYEERPHWKNMEPPRTREESWTAQYKRRIEAQKAEAILRDMERRKGPMDMMPGPSFEQDVPLHYEREHNHLPMEAPPSPEGRYSISQDEGSGRKFFFAGPRDQKPTLYEDRYGAPKRKDSFEEPEEYRHIPKEFYQEMEREREPKPTVSNIKGEPSVSEPIINPNDFIEEFDDDDWNELGALVKNHSRKRLNSSQEQPPAPSKKPVAVPSSIQESFSTYPGTEPTTPRKVHPLSLSFFREELPSMRSSKGFSGYPGDYPPQRGEFPQHQRWESGPPEHNGSSQSGYGYK